MPRSARSGLFFASSAPPFLVAYLEPFCAQTEGETAETTGLGGHGWWNLAQTAALTGPGMGQSQFVSLGAGRYRAVKV